jgi:hypothetical protein
MFKFATEILTIVVLMKFLKNHNTLSEQSNHPHIKNGEYVTYLSNVSIDNNVVDAIGIFKVWNSTDFYSLKKKFPFRDDFTAWCEFK